MRSALRSGSGLDSVLHMNYLTHRNEARDGAETGYCDANGCPILIGDQVTVPDRTGTHRVIGFSDPCIITTSTGAYDHNDVVVLY